jgi:protein-tyrosine phosphatase
MLIKVLFVCLGNICRSPTAHVIFEQKVKAQGLNKHIVVDSAGTGDWNIGRPPDERIRKVAAEYGYTMDHLRARKVSVNDFDEFDYIFAMDKNNLRDLETFFTDSRNPDHHECPGDRKAEIALFLPFSGISEIDEVPDPYYGGNSDFENVLSVVNRATDKLIDVIKRKHLPSLQ